jgi:hypothetical protein
MPTPGLIILAAGLGRRFGGLKQLAPVGPHGEAIMDYSVRDALEARFGSVVVVVRSEIEAAVADHIERRWPSGLDASLVCQDRDTLAVRAGASGRTEPLGTAHALLCGASRLTGPFAVINADDLYGLTPYRTLAAHFAGGGADALVVFEVAKTLVSDEPVTRALCEVDEAGHLAGIEEGTVSRVGRDGALGWIGSSGREMALLGSEPVSMNFWGFTPLVLASMERAVEQFVSSGAPSGREILLPDVVREGLACADGPPFTVLMTSGVCLGITHAGDVAIVRAALLESARQGDARQDDARAEAARPHTTS